MASVCCGVDVAIASAAIFWGGTFDDRIDQAASDRSSRSQHAVMHGAHIVLEVVEALHSPVHPADTKVQQGMSGNY